AQMTIGGAPFAPGNNYIFDRDVRWLASIRGRFGYAADRWLLYVTGGGAWGQIEHTVGPIFGTTYGPVSGNDTRSGWVIGGGLEYAFTNNWTGRIEYLFYDLQDSSVFNPVAAFPTFGATTAWENQINVVRLGVNYKF